MLNQIRYIETLVYYDCVQLFLGCGNSSVKYLCLLSYSHDDYDLYLCVNVTDTELDCFLADKLDIVDIYKDTKDKKLFTMKIFGWSFDVFDAYPVELCNVPPDWLPCLIN